MGTVVKKEHPYYSNILFTILIFGISLAPLFSTSSSRIDYYSRRKLQVYFSSLRNFNKLFLKLFKFLFSCFFRYVGWSWTDRSTFVFKKRKITRRVLRWGWQEEKSTRKIIFSILDFILTNDRISGYEAGREEKESEFRVSEMQDYRRKKTFASTRRDLFRNPCNLSKQVIPRNVHGRKT